MRLLSNTQGHMLKELRGSLTLIELANKAGLTAGALSRIERGELKPSANTLGRIASALKLNQTQTDQLFVEYELWPEDMSNNRELVISLWRKHAS